MPRRRRAATRTAQRSSATSRAPGLQQSTEDTGQTGSCVAGLVYVYDHAARDLSKRLVQEFHGHHDLALATLHVHLDDNNCMEMTALKGDAAEVKHFADHIIAERGVRYGRVVMIPTGEGEAGEGAEARAPAWVRRDFCHGHSRCVSLSAGGGGLGLPVEAARRCRRGGAPPG